MKKIKGNIIIGVCGGIAVYKICSLVRLLVKNNFSVKVVMTPAAIRFVSPLLFKELTYQPVYTEMFSLEGQGVRHVKLSNWADLAVVAPLSANTLAKIACGICDNLLTTIICALSFKKPVLFVPSMNEEMWANPVVGKNINSLKSRENYKILLPAAGDLACKSKGIGRMPEPENIYRKVKLLLK